MAENHTPEIPQQATPPPYDAGLDGSLKRALLRQNEQEAAYHERRGALQEKLARAGLTQEAAAGLLEAFESSWRPGFGTAAMRGMLNRPIRNLYDEAARLGVQEKDFAPFIAALTEHRAASDTLHRLEQTVLSTQGAQFFERAVAESDRLKEMRSEVIDAARAVNPEITVSALDRLAGGDAGFDPLARTVTVALDFDDTVARPRQELYKTLWLDLAPLLTTKERGVLEDAWSRDAKDGQSLESWASEKFAEVVAPARRKRVKGVFKEIMAPPEAFLSRVSNAARGRGYRAPEDIWFAAKQGDLARRRQQLVAGDALRVPSSKESPTAHEATVLSIGKMSDQELSERLDRQEAAIADVARRRSRITRQLIVNPLMRNRLARRARAALNWFSGNYQDPVDEENRDIRDLQRGTVALKAELRARQAVRQMTVDPSSATPEPPTSGPSPDSPPPGGPGGGVRGLGETDVAMPGMARHVMAAMAQSSNDEQRQDNVVPFPGDGSLPEERTGAASRETALGEASLNETALGGAAGIYHIAAREGREHPYYVVEMTPNGADPGERFGVAIAGTSAAAGRMVAAMDAARPTGAASQAATELAKQAAAADKAAREAGIENPLAGVDAVRASGLLDKELDDTVSKADLQALAFPTMTGDVVWRDQQGGWHAGSLQAFQADRGVRQDRSLSGARQALETAANTMADRSKEQSDRVWLDVPQAEEGRATDLGARYDELHRRWYAPDVATAQATLKWQGDQKQKAASGPHNIDEGKQGGKANPTGARTGEASMQAGGARYSAAAASGANEQDKPVAVVLDVGREAVSSKETPAAAEAMAEALRARLSGFDVVLVTDRAAAVDSLTKAAGDLAREAIAVDDDKLSEPLTLVTLADQISESMNGKPGIAVSLWNEGPGRDTAAGASITAKLSERGMKTAPAPDDREAARLMSEPKLTAAYKETMAARARRATAGGPPPVSLANRLLAYAAEMTARGIEVPNEQDSKKQTAKASRKNKGQGR